MSQLFMLAKLMGHKDFQNLKPIFFFFFVFQVPFEHIMVVFSTSPGLAYNGIHCLPYLQFENG